MDAGDQTGSVTTKKIGLGLGYFSIALGLVELAAPGRLARWLGVENKAARNTVIAMGLRELFAGGLLLRGPAVSTNVWNRVTARALDRKTGRTFPRFNSPNDPVNKDFKLYPSDLAAA